MVSTGQESIIYGEIIVNLALTVGFQLLPYWQYVVRVGLTLHARYVLASIAGSATYTFRVIGIRLDH